MLTTYQTSRRRPDPLTSALMLKLCWVSKLHQTTALISTRKIWLFHFDLHGIFSPLSYKCWLWNPLQHWTMRSRLCFRRERKLSLYLILHFSLLDLNVIIGLVRYLLELCVFFSPPTAWRASLNLLLSLDFWEVAVRYYSQQNSFLSNIYLRVSFS